MPYKNTSFQPTHSLHLFTPPIHFHSAAILWSPMQILGASGADASRKSTVRDAPPDVQASTSGLGSPGSGRTLLAPRAGPSPLGDLALHLLLLLVYGPDDPPATCNPFRRAIASMEDADDPLTTGPYTNSQDQTTRLGDSSVSLIHDTDSSSYGRLLSVKSDTSSSGAPATLSFSPGRIHPESQASPQPSVSFRQLHDALATWALPSDPEPAALLLYCLVHRCPGFRDHVLSRTDMGVLMLPLLRLVHLCPPEAACHSHTLQVGIFD